MDTAAARALEGWGSLVKKLPPEAQDLLQDPKAVAVAGGLLSAVCVVRCCCRCRSRGSAEPERESISAASSIRRSGAASPDVPPARRSELTGTLLHRPEPPPVLYVRSPTRQQDYSGVYVLMQGEWPNGCAAWAKDDKSKYLYSTQTGKWAFCSPRTREKGFSGNSGWIVSAAPHQDLMPHVIRSWKSWNGAERILDDAIVVSASPLD
eukprot:TRINITY_DN9895_c0_g1_i1.p1 TRINITY_DN9895_c0_g1~~TRINITY_DN9895_c0_g1_i1.p1  ORF type:complete len:224 (+),score=45.90 TRINITY_DN9895_c0_g1_i1:49-672(+)